MLTKEEIIRELLSDPILVEKGILKPDEYKSIRLNQDSEHLIIDLIKLVSSLRFDDETENRITREVNNFFSKRIVKEKTLKND